MVHGSDLNIGDEKVSPAGGPSEVAEGPSQLRLLEDLAVVVDVLDKLFVEEWLRCEGTEIRKTN